MKMLLPILMCALLAGCRSPTYFTEATLAEGRYEICLPHLVADIGSNHNPTVWVYECGRMEIDTAPLTPGNTGEIWVNWLDGTVHGVMSHSNVEEVIGFELGCDGTNAYLDITVDGGNGIRYRINKKTAGQLEVKEERLGQ